MAVSPAADGDGKGGGGDGLFHFAVDRGGTFTDVHAVLPNGEERVSKLLSEDPDNYSDAPTEGIRRVLDEFGGKAATGGGGGGYPRGRRVCTDEIGSIRMGTTVATNALLERKGERMGLLITKGFRDLLKIGNQSREDIFDLTCRAHGLLYEEVVEVDERIMLEAFWEGGENDDGDSIGGNGESESDASSNDDLPPAGVGPRRVGSTSERIIALRPPNLDTVRAQLESLASNGIRSIAIVFLHSYVDDEHELMVGKLAREMGCFKEVSCSSQVMPMVKMVPRGHTACAAAYLTPKITSYLSSFREGFDENLSKVRLDFMKSDGGLTPVDDFGGHQAILSGPAGGVVGYAKTAYRPPRGKSASGVEGGHARPTPVIGFDMGGTSTDVSRYAGSLEHVFETTTAGVAIQAPQLDIHTVAAGGGSRLFLRTGMFVVGPESAGAHPGPVCYRKGGHLAVTDANLVLGRVLPDHFPSIFGPNEDEPLDLDGARKAFAELSSCPEASGRTPEELAHGFIKVANEAMCRPIRNLTQMKGHDVASHVLACFGGAGPQHACAMARNLGMKRVFVHRYGGVLSAYGLSMADAVREEQEPSADIYERAGKPGEDFSRASRVARLANLAAKAKQALVRQGYDESKVVVEHFLNMRYQGTDSSLMISEPEKSKDYGGAFRERYRREFGFELSGRDILVDDYRIRAVVPGSEPPNHRDVSLSEAPEPTGMTRAYFEGGWREVGVHRMEDLFPGHVVKGPGIIVQSISTIVLEVGCTAQVTADGDLDIEVVGPLLSGNDTDAAVANESGRDVYAEETPAIKEDPVQLSIFGHRFMGIAEQMGRTLARTAISVNIKERLDFSCALFSADGGLVANAPHIPVHLGAMQSAVRFQVEYWNSEGREGIQKGDVLVSNHPQLAGGSHLPDITVITPVFHANRIVFFVASRGHHADIGGIAPGSMPPQSQRLVDEGALIVAHKLVKDGRFDEEGITEILMSPGKLPGNSGTRNLRDNLSDLKAQVAANNAGIRLLGQLVEENTYPIVHAYMKFIQQNAELAVRDMLRSFAAKHDRRVTAVDYMDDGSPIKLSVDIDTSTGDAVFDFTGTGPQVLGNHNAPPAVTYSAVIYSLRSLVGLDIPLNQGCLTPITFVIPRYCLLNPSDDAGVVGGNVLTSQRVVDVVLKAFKACAASQGCMNNLTFGDERFGYYETLAGGAGAGPTWTGRDGVHTHCTNTRITDPEILERRYPVLLRQFGLRAGSGGAGKNRGGNGVIREIEPLRPLVMSILSERRALQPYGMAGGLPGERGRNLVVKNNGIVVNVGGRCSGTLGVGERLRIETPGAGGYGKPEIRVDGDVAVTKQ